VPYAREEQGLASAFMGARLSLLLVVAVIVGCAGLAAAWMVPAGPVAVGASLLAFAAVIAFSVRRIGGFTGDVLGAAGVVGETVGLLVAAARW
jgi:adenosylcobinamide-GDP ribazoletransferase